MLEWIRHRRVRPPVSSTILAGREWVGTRIGSVDPEAVGTISVLQKQDHRDARAVGTAPRRGTRLSSTGLKSAIDPLLTSQV